MLDNIVNDIKKVNNVKNIEEENLNRELEALLKDFSKNEEELRQKSLSYEEMKKEIIKLDNKYKEKVINLRNRIEIFK